MITMQASDGKKPVIIVGLNQTELMSLLGAKMINLDLGQIQLMILGGNDDVEIEAKIKNGVNGQTNTC